MPTGKLAGVRLLVLHIQSTAEHDAEMPQWRTSKTHACPSVPLSYSQLHRFLAIGENRLGLLLFLTI